MDLLSYLRSNHTSSQDDSTNETSRALILFDGGTTDNFGATDVFLWFSCIIIAVKCIVALLAFAYLTLDPVGGGAEVSSYGSVSSGWNREQETDRLDDQQFKSKYSSDYDYKDRYY